jgi:hypothetical protein
MKLPSLTVYIEYRIKSGEAAPRWKTLRARVRQELPPDHPDGLYAYGKDLVHPTHTSIDVVTSQCIALLQDKAERIWVVTDPLLKFASPCRCFQAGKVVSLNPIPQAIIGAA